MTAGRNSISKNKDWCTPPKYVEAVRKVFDGKIFLDPASNKYSLVHADVEYLSPKKDGLKESWNYPTIYLNPPYGRFKSRKASIYDWLKRCNEANQQYKSEVIALVPVAPNTNHWKQFVFTKATAICFLYDTRLKFFKEGKEITKGASMACCMIYWGKNYNKFYNIFINHGAVVDIRSLKRETIGGKK
jgi:hypothetical protein